MASSIFLQPSLVGAFLPSDGTAGAPIYSFASEPTLGFFRSAAATVKLSGAFVATGTITTATNVILGSLNLLIFGANGLFGSPADGQFNWTNSAQSAGAGIDITTDAVLKIRTRAQTGYATIDCLGLKASGAAGASGTGTVVSQLTVVNGIVTSCTIA